METQAILEWQGELEIQFVNDYSEGQVMSAVQLIATFIATMLIMGIVLGSQFLTSDIVRKETVAVQVTRTENAALALTSVPNGHIEIPLNGYEFRWVDPVIYLRYQDEVESTSLKLLENGYSDVIGPDEYTEVQEKLCLKKQGDILIFQTSPCEE